MLPVPGISNWPRMWTDEMKPTWFKYYKLIKDKIYWTAGTSSQYTWSYPTYNVLTTAVNTGNAVSYNTSRPPIARLKWKWRINQRLDMNNAVGGPYNRLVYEAPDGLKVNKDLYIAVYPVAEPTWYYWHYLAPAALPVWCAIDCTLSSVFTFTD